MGKLSNLSGKVFGRLTVTSEFTRRSKQTYWLCRCECGTEKLIYSGSLKRGITTSCGCYQREVTAQVGAATKRHGLHGHPLYNLFMKLRDRCENPNNPAYKNYGGRGIACLFFGPVEFIEWAEANGYRAGLSIDRIDNDGPYSPENCRWASSKQQCRNTRRNRIVEHGGEALCVAEWAERQNLTLNAVYGRVRKGRTFEQALELVA